jgi:NADP-dependent 3-hydroxy acid dehydrogenase YdfG
MNGKRVLLTGGSRGIGRTTALALAKAGAQVMVCARAMDELLALQAEMPEQLHVFQGDVSVEADVAALVAATIEQLGGLDVVINNAGIGIFRPLDQISEDEWDRVMNVNAKGTFLVCRHVVPILRGQGRGHIVIIASDVAKRTFSGGSVYCASKYAQEGLAGSLRKELRPEGIKVSVVYSGLVDTHFHDSPKGDERKVRWLSEQDMADAILYVCNQPAHVVIDELMIHPLSQDY